MKGEIRASRVLFGVPSESVSTRPISQNAFRQIVVLKRLPAGREKEQAGHPFQP